MFPVSLHEDIHNCVNCGMCHQVCPTYRAMRTEFHAPRGRVQIIKYYLEGKLKTQDVQKIMATCIQCNACSAFCVSGVRIDRIFSSIVREIAESRTIQVKTKIINSLLANNTALHAMVKTARIMKGFAGSMRSSAKIGNIPLSRLPSFNDRSFRSSAGAVLTTRGKRTGRVAYFTGCATELLYEDVGRSVLNVLGKLGIDVVIPRDQVCCGAPLLQKGAWKQALPSIIKNLKLFDRNDIDAIVVDCGTCGATLKKRIPELLEDLPQYGDQARRLAAKVKDISQIVNERLDDLPLTETLSKKKPEAIKVTYHDPCHLLREMGAVKEPRNILAALEGIHLVEMEGADECCGGGGMYQFENKGLSGLITKRKLKKNQ